MNVEMRILVNGVPVTTIPRMDLHPADSIAVEIRSDAGTHTRMLTCGEVYDPKDPGGRCGWWPGHAGRHHTYTKSGGIEVWW